LDFSLPVSECSTEQKFHGCESSLCGLFAPGTKVQIPMGVRLVDDFNSESIENSAYSIG